MKIICDSCGAKYSIADDKVRGKVFKIRCKKCSDIIMVHGPSQDGVSEEPVNHEEVAASPPEVTENTVQWFVVIDGEQVGPVTPHDVEMHFIAGRLHPESYIWREGLADWSSLRNVEDFAHLVVDTAGPSEQTVVAGHALPSSVSQPPSAPASEKTEIVNMNEVPRSSETLRPEEKTFVGAAAMPGASPVEDFETIDSSFPSQSEDLPVSASYLPTSSDRHADAYIDGGVGAHDRTADQTLADWGRNQAGSQDYSGLTDELIADDSDEAAVFNAFDDFGYGASDGQPSLNQDSPSRHVLEDITGRSQAPKVVSGESFIGRRNENSVLFSLNNLEDLQSPSSNEHGQQGSVTEGSGLIDIQSLASSHKAVKDSSSVRSSSVSGLHSFNPQSMHIPALMPMGSHRSNKWLILAVVIGGCLLVAVTVTAVLLVVKSPQATTHTIVEAVSAHDEQGDEAMPPSGSPEVEEAAHADVDEDEARALQAARVLAMQEEGKADEDELEAVKEASEKGDSAPTASAESQKKAQRRDQARTTKSEPKAKRTQKSSKRSEPKAAAPTPRRDSKPAKTSKAAPSGLDDILGQMSGSGTSGSSASASAPPAPKAEAPKKVASDLPPALTRPMVQSTVARYNTHVLQCAQSSNRTGLRGVVFVRYTIEPSGAVSNAEVQTPEFKGTDLGRCIENVVRSMQFPETQSSRTINYPFDLS